MLPMTLPIDVGAAWMRMTGQVWVNTLHVAEVMTQATLHQQRVFLGLDHPGGVHPEKPAPARKPARKPVRKASAKTTAKPAAKPKPAAARKPAASTPKPAATRARRAPSKPPVMPGNPSKD